MDQSEQLLNAWLNLSAVLRNERFVTNLSFNEAFICSLINNQKQDNPSLPCLTIKDICTKTGMLKSQANKTINSLVAKNMAERIRLPGDQRLVYIGLTENGIRLFKLEHQNILNFVNKTSILMGEKDTKDTIRLFNKLSDILHNLINKGDA